MAERTPFLLRPLRQQIRRHLRSGFNAKSPLWLSLGLMAAQSGTPIQAEEDTHIEWRCKIGAEQTWDCREIRAPGPTYTRPKHSAVYQQPIAASPTDKPAPLRYDLDWVDEEQLTAEQRAQIPLACCGAYIEPKRKDSDAKLDPDRAPLRASADNSELQQETIAILEGDVRLTQGYRQVAADKLTLDQSTDIAALEGEIQLREPGLLLSAHGATLDIQTGHSELRDAQFVLHQTRIRGGAEQLNHRSDKTLVLIDGSFTQCEPDSNFWELRSSKLTIDPTNSMGSGKHVRVNIKGVPVFYTPYLSFPLGEGRKTGFLFPSVGSSDDGGPDVSLPYYLNLAPNYDLTLTPRYIADRGEMLEAQFRHLSQSFRTDLSIAALGSDQGGNDQDKEDQLEDLLAEGRITQEEFDAQLRPFEGEDRWLINIDHTGGDAERWNTRIDYTKVSDIDYFRDLDTTSLDVNSTTHLKKSGELGYVSDNWTYTLKLEEFQTIVLNTEVPYKQLPRIDIDGHYRLGDWDLSLNHEYVRFDHRDDVHGPDNAIPVDPRILGERARLDYQLSWDKQWLWGFFKPSAMVKSLAYQLDEEQILDSVNDTPSITVGQGSLDMGLVFEREDSLFGANYLQTFEPRLFYFYSDFESHEELFNLTSRGRDIDFDTSELTFSYDSLFRDTRFSGGDRIDDANQVTVGLTTRFISEDGTERLRASLGQIFYQSERRVTLTDTFSLEEIEDPDARVAALEAALGDSDLKVSTAAANQLAELQKQIQDESELAAQLAGQLGDYWRYSLDAAWNDHSGKVSRGNASLRYFDDEGRIFNLGYRFNRKDFKLQDLNQDSLISSDEVFDQTIDQANLSFIWPLIGNWNLIGHGNHDFTNDRELETFAGFEYNNCCYRVRLVARRWLDNELINSISDTIADTDLEYDRGVFLEFQLKGLGGIGGKVSGILEDAIVNSSRREETLP